MFLISWLKKVTFWTIYYENKDLSKINLDKYRNTNIGIVFQSYNLLSLLTVMENIVLLLKISGIKDKSKKETTINLMKNIRLNSEHSNRRVLKLSGG